MALKGNDQDNYFFGTRFDDEIFGFGGKDEISGSPGSDRIDGGDDIDTVYYNLFHPPYPGMSFLRVEGEAVDVDLERATQFGGLAEGDVLIDVENVFGSIEDDTIRGDGEDNELAGKPGNDILDGRAGNDILHGEFDDDSLSGGIGHDLLFGGDDNDTLIGGADADLLDGEAGVDTANYLASPEPVVVRLDNGTGQGGDAAGDVLIEVENVVGSTLSDSLTGSAGANLLAGSFGNDLLAGLAGGDTLNGGNGSDTATYVASASGVTVDLSLGTGSGGDAAGDSLISIENLTGSSLADTLVGNSFANVLDGGGGTDTMEGGLGNDTYIIDNIEDVIVESTGAGNDTLRASVSYKLAADAEIEILRTVDDTGTAAINLGGNAFANQIIGNNGDNRLSGGGGADTLIGSRGVDTLTGGSGGDTFVWRDINESGTSIPTMDRIVDFDPLTGDLIDLAGVDADVFAAGNQAFTFIGAAGFSGTPGEINFVHVGGETIIQLQTGVGGDIEMGIRLQGIVTPEASWFVL